MTSTISSDTLAGLAAEFAALVTRLQQADLIPGSDDEVLEFWRAVEVQQRRLAAVDHAVIADVERRGLPGLHACVSTVVFTRQVLNVAPGEAKARVDAAHRLGPRHLVSGPAVPPQFPDTAHAVASGAVSSRHAAVITRAVGELPDEVVDELGGWVEQHLLEHAGSLDPVQLARYARGLVDRLDQDGQYQELDYQQRRRELRIFDRPDGSCRIEGSCTAEAAEHLRVFFDACAKPVKGPDGSPDPRSAGQRRHDALLELVQMAMRTDQLPNAGGMTATIVLTMDAEAFATGVGTATTGHGYAVPADVAKRWAEPEARMIAVLLRDAKRVEAYSSTQRCFSEQQRLVLTARDKGCTFPGCDRPPGWTQAHHVIEYAAGGQTRVDNGTLLCGHHHRSFEAAGWAVHIRDGSAWWTPPRWIDADRTPIRNTVHDHCNL
jgi:hypothetical protein